MGKKKVKEDSAEKVKSGLSPEQVVKSLNKTFGEGVIMPASQIIEKKTKIIPIGPMIDVGIHGGVPEGSWLILSGPPKCGKSTTALEFASNAQKPENGGKNVYYIDAEGRLKKMNLEGIKDLQPDKFQVIKSTPGNILGAEKLLTIATEIVKNDFGCVLIIDSSSALCSEKELTDDVSGQTRSLGPKILSNFCKKMGTVVPIQNTIIVMIQHLIANTSGYGPSQYEDGGRKIQYQVDIKLRCKGFQSWVDKDDNAIGQTVDWQVVCAALGGPGANIKSHLRYGHGIDKVWENIELACDLALITKAGSWYTLNFLKDTPKFQGQGKVWQHLVDVPSDYKILTDSLDGMLK